MLYLLHSLHILSTTTSIIKTFILMNKITVLLIIPLLFGTTRALSLETRDSSKIIFDRGIEQHTFVPKGQWFTGLSVSYLVNSSDNYKILILDQLKGEGYTLKLSPYLGYSFSDNLAAGVRFKYKRTYINVESLRIKFSDDIDIEIDNAYSLEHSYYGTAFVRNYISLGKSMRFGLYNELQLTLGGGQGKITSGSGDSFTGTYQNTFEFELGMAPGLVAFINNVVAVDVSIGVLGFNVKDVKQTTDQIYVGSQRTTSADFKIDIFSISLGISFYIPTLNPF